MQPFLDYLFDRQQRMRGFNFRVYFIICYDRITRNTSDGLNEYPLELFYF